MCPEASWEALPPTGAASTRAETRSLRGTGPSGSEADRVLRGRIVEADGHVGPHLQQALFPCLASDFAPNSFPFSKARLDSP